MSYVCSTNYVACALTILSNRSSQQPWEASDVISPVFQLKKRQQTWDDLLRVTQLVSVCGEVWTQVCLILGQGFIFCATSCVRWELRASANHVYKRKSILRGDHPNYTHERYLRAQVPFDPSVTFSQLFCILILCGEESRIKQIFEWNK